jgi:hypothetical protein
MSATLPMGAAQPASSGEPRRWAGRRWLPLVLIAWVIIASALLVMNQDPVAQLEFRDPDDQLRLQQVRDLLAGQSWFDVHQYRVDPAGGGVAMHWSRLVDIPIAAAMVLLEPLLGNAGAERAMLLAVPALTLLAILALTGWMASRTLPRGAAGFSMLAMAFAVPVMLQVLPLRIDHHGWQIALFLLAMAAMLDGNDRRGGWITGSALAAWMAISFEGLPMSAWIIAVLALFACHDVAARTRLVAALQALTAVSAALFLATRGLGELANHCDAIAPVHLAMFAWGALAISAANAWRPESRASLLAGLSAAGAGAIGLVMYAAPQCASGTFDMIDPVVRSFWYDNVQEGKTLFLSPWHIVAQHLAAPLVGLAVTVRLARRAQGRDRRWWLTCALVLGAGVVLGMLVSRSIAYAAALAVLPLGWLFHAWLTGLKRPANPVLRFGELLGVAGMIFVILLPVVPVMAVETLLGAGSLPERGKDAGKIACSTRAATAAIEALPPGDILAPIDFGPDILVGTNRAVLATGHHRGATAIRQVIDAFSGTPAEARTVMLRNDLRYVIVCPNVQEMALYRKRSPDGFAVHLLDGRPPAWLRPIELPAASGLRMWRVAD